MSLVKGINYKIFALFLLGSVLTHNLKASEKASNINNEIDNKKYTEYILGTGDTLFINFFGIPFFSGNYTIQPNGFIFLPEIGKLKVREKTITELKDLLEKKYADFIYEPEISLSISDYRPVNVTLRGEVNKTGLFQMDYVRLDKKIKNDNFTSNNNYNSIIKPYLAKFTEPKLFSLIALGEGITSYADLTNIQIIRKNSNANGGGYIKTSVNMIDLLENGNQSVNLSLRDGDDILVPRSEKVLLEQLLEINKSNLTPDEIIIYVNGNVQKTGSIMVKSGTSLLEAIAYAGGRKTFSGNIQFIRLSNKSKTKKKIIKYNEKSIKGSSKNPILINGDIIYVTRSIMGKANNIIKEYSSPLINSYGIYKVFD